MSEKIEIIKTKDERTLSEEFDSASPNTQRNVLMYTNGVKPTSKYKAIIKFRSDSIEHSPATESVLIFHGLKKEEKVKLIYK